LRQRNDFSAGSLVAGFLDEATAALDQKSEEKLIERLKSIEPRPSAILVAHRQSTLSHCDSMLSIQHGMVRVGR